MKLSRQFRASMALAALGAALLVPSAAADEVINDDLIVDGSECVGFDCMDGEAFGFDTIKLKENNLRIKFDDTSTAASFPRNDWQIRINDSANGGLSKFAIDDITAGRTPFTIEAGAPSNSLYVDDGGNIGIGTSTPSVELHIKEGDTPTVRLDQDGSSGWAPQIWDIAGNETNFFVRDVTNGSQLPFRIRPGAPSSSIDIGSTGNVGMGITSPDGRLHVQTATAGSVAPNNAKDDFVIENNTAGGMSILVPDGFQAGIAFGSPANPLNWAIQTVQSTSFDIFRLGVSTFHINSLGNVGIGGTTAGASATNSFAVFNGVAPAGSVTNGVILYSADAAASAELRVRDEAGNITTLSPHNFTLFTPGPADPYPWSYYAKNEFLGEELNVDMSGAIRALEKLTGKKFIHRRKFAARPWKQSMLVAAVADREQAILKIMSEEVPISAADAIETVDVMETVDGTDTESFFRFDPQIGKVVTAKRPKKITRPTGKKQRRIKAGIWLDEKTGKFLRKKTRKEAEAEIPAAKVPPMPKWMATRIVSKKQK